MTTKFRRMMWLVLAVLGALAAQGATGVAREQRAADVTIRAGEQPIVLQLPAGGVATFEVLQRLLSAAQVRYALEEAPSPPEPVPVDLARRPEQEIALNGLRLGEALDRIIAADPRYQWEESAGRLFVRAAGGRSALDLRLPQLVLERASLPEAIKALMRVLDPDRAPGGILVSGVTLTVSPGTADTKPGSHPGISVRLEQVTLLEALNAIAGSRIDLSWVVRQDGAGDVDGVGITLSTPSAGVTALSDRMVRAPRPRSRLSVPLSNGIRIALSAYSHQAKVRVGLENVPTEMGLERTPHAGSIDLTGVPATESISRIVARDSRYEWFDAAGIYDVRPARHVREHSPLDQPVAEFRAPGETVATILERIATLLGGRTTGGGEGWGSLPGSPERLKAEADQKRPISFDLGATTVREILNTLCRTQGTLSWSVTPQRRSDGQVLVTVQADSWDGWGPSRSFTVSKW